MMEGVKQNSLGLWEVFHGGEFVARLHEWQEDLARQIYEKELSKTLDEIDRLKAEERSG